MIIRMIVIIIIMIIIKTKIMIIIMIIVVVVVVVIIITIGENVIVEEKSSLQHCYKCLEADGKINIKKDNY